MHETPFSNSSPYISFIYPPTITIHPSLTHWLHCSSSHNDSPGLLHDASKVDRGIEEEKLQTGSMLLVYGKEIGRIGQELGRRGEGRRRGLHQFLHSYSFSKTGVMKLSPGEYHVHNDQLLLLVYEVIGL